MKSPISCINAEQSLQSMRYRLASIIWCFLFHTRHKGGIAITETPQIAPIEQLAKRTDITAYIGNPQLVSSPCLNHLMSEDTVETIYNADDPYNSTWNRQAALDFVAKNPDAIVYAGPTGNKDDDRHMAIAASQEKTAIATFDWVSVS